MLWMRGPYNLQVAYSDISVFPNLPVKLKQLQQMLGHHTVIITGNSGRPSLSVTPPASIQGQVRSITRHKARNRDTTHNTHSRDGSNGSMPPHSYADN